MASFFCDGNHKVTMIGVEEYMKRSDQDSVTSEETYYSDDSVTVEEEEYEDEEYYETAELCLEEFPYVMNPSTVVTNPIRTINTKVPEINPWTKKKQDETVPSEQKSFLEILEEEEKMEKDKKQKREEDRMRKAKFKRKQVLQFKSNTKPTESLLLKNRNVTHSSKESSLEWRKKF